MILFLHSLMEFDFVIIHSLIILNETSNATYTFTNTLALQHVPTTELTHNYAFWWKKHLFVLIMQLISAWARCQGVPVLQFLHVAAIYTGERGTWVCYSYRFALIHSLHYSILTHVMNEVFFILWIMIVVDDICVNKGF